MINIFNKKFRSLKWLLEIATSIVETEDHVMHLLDDYDEKITAKEQLQIYDRYKSKGNYKKL